MWSRRGIVTTVVVVALGAACSSSSVHAAKSTTTTTSAPNAFHGSADSAFCNFVRQSRTTLNTAGAARTPAQNKAAYERLLPVLAHAAAIAPDVIKQDFDVYVGAYRRFLGVLAAANYDDTKVDRSKLKFLQDRPMVTASQRITQYTQQICHIGVAPSA
jgi:hypothetical protein